MSGYWVPANEVRSETRVANSRFITTVAPVFSVEEARRFVARIKDEFPGATHNVPAYLIGHGPSVTAHCSDDGEPPGTAGRPVLAVLLGSGLGDVAVVVTRYFGGTKLGTGGLVRAYAQAAAEALTAVPRAVRTRAHTILVVTSYSLLDPLRRAVQAHQGRILGEVFAADVTVTAQLAVEQFAPFQGALSDLSRGTLRAEIIETGDTTLVPAEGRGAG